jgi:DNA-binding NarL/FixJ family response regulator
MEWYPWIHAWLHCEALAHAGRFEEATELACLEYQQGVEDASRERRSFFAWHLATFVPDRGHVRSAARWAREGIALNRELGRTHYVGECLIGLAMALAIAGRTEDAKQALADFDDLGIPDLMFKPVEHLLAQGWTAVAAGDRRGGARHFEQARQRAAAGGDRAGEASAAHALARIGQPQDALDTLTRLAAEMEGDLPAGRLAHVRGLVDLDPDVLSEASQAFEAMGAHLLAAEAAADAAVAWRRAGEPRRASVVERRARALAELAESPVTPALRTLEIRVQLTPSEHRVAVMAAAGRHNRQIAEELGVSVRTVENHLQRAYDKLGVAGRAELGAVFADGLA